MEKITHHPVRAQADALKRALLLCGFQLIDDGEAPEIEAAEWQIPLFNRVAGTEPEPLAIDEPGYCMRSELLAAQLANITPTLPLRVFATGRVYDRKLGQRPCRSCIQGIIAQPGFELRHYERFWSFLAQAAFGIPAKSELVARDNGAYEVLVTLGETTFILATTGKASTLARALLGLAATDPVAWVFDIDIDAVALAAFGIASRDQLFSVLEKDLRAHTSTDPTFGTPNYSRAANVLRDMGFAEFTGMKIYREDCYRKMNMIQEAWDRNNKGIQLQEPIEEFSGLPTVLTPALEEAMGANWAAGETECKIFEIGHIFLPGQNGGAPIEKRALSFGAYGPNLDGAKWRAIVDEFLTRFGIDHHYFIPLPPGKAPAYHPADCWLLMDQNMTYLESNFGAIHPIALANHGIGCQAYMAQFEFGPISAKADEDFNFVAPDYQ